MLGMRMPPGGEEVPVGEVVRQVCHFENILRQKQFHLFPWVPSHIIHDAELDDMLALILVVCVNMQMRQMKPFVLAQMPEDASLVRLREAFETRMQNTQVYTDPAARNAEAIRLFWSL
jgi:elongation factor P--beta-lysine ligase